MKKIVIVFFMMMLIFAIFLPIVQSNNINKDELRKILLPPMLAYEPKFHDFGFVEEGDSYQTEFYIWNEGTGTLTWNLGIVNPWLSPDPTSGSSTVGKTTITVTIDTTGLAVGNYTGSVGIAANDGGGMRFFDVSFIVDSPPDTPSIPSGPNTGLIDEEYSYFSYSNDSDLNWISYRFDFGNRISNWTMFTASGVGNFETNNWSVPGLYEVKAQAKDIYGAISNWSSPLLVTITSGNNPPEKPSKPSGPSNGKAGNSYTYNSSTTDIDGDQIYYLFDWGDGNNSGWVGPFNSGEAISESYLWSAQGSYSIKVKAKDINNEESTWSDSLVVSMPRNKRLYLIEDLSCFIKTFFLWNFQNKMIFKILF